MDSPLVTETWKAHIWEAGEDITADKLNTLEQQVAKITAPALGAIRYDVKQNISGEAVDNLRNNLDINIATTRDVGIIKAKQSAINYEAQTSDDLYEQSENSPSPCIANSIVSADGTLTVQVPLATYSQPGAVMIKGDSGLEFAREAEVIVDGSEITPGEEGEPQPGWLKVKQMTGATSSTAGNFGAPPAPAAGQQGRFLRGDGTWSSPSNNRVAMTLNNSAKAYLLGTTTNPGSSAQNVASVANKSIYMDTYGLNLDNIRLTNISIQESEYPCFGLDNCGGIILEQTGETIGDEVLTDSVMLSFSDLKKLKQLIANFNSLTTLAEYSSAIISSLQNNSSGEVETPGTEEVAADPEDPNYTGDPVETVVTDPTNPDTPPDDVVVEEEAAP